MTCSSNLNAAEDRIRKLEAVFSDLHPELDLATLLYDNLDGPLIVPHCNASEPLRTEVADVQSRDFVHESASPAAEEALPQQADGFDWAEETTLSGLSDGMAALSIKPEGTGYLGEASRTN